MKLNFAQIFSTFVELIVVANLGKNLRPSVPKWSTGQ